MLNFQEAKRLREEIAASGKKVTFDRYHLSSCPVQIGLFDSADTLHQEDSAPAEMRAPENLFGEPVDRSCLIGVAQRTFGLKSVRVIRLKSAAVVGYSSAIDENGNLFSSVAAGDEKEFRERAKSSRFDYEGFCISDAAPHIEAVFVSRQERIYYDKCALFIPYIEQGNYGSFIVRAIHKILLAKDLKLKPDLIIVPERVSWLMELLAILELDYFPIYTVKEVNGDIFKELIYITDFEAEGFASDSAYSRFQRFMHDHFPINAKTEQMSLFVSRNTSAIARPWYRVLKNELALEKIAETKNYKVIRPETLTLSGQINTFRQAKRVVGASGSGMLNCVFSPEGTKIVDMESFHSTVRQHAKVYSSSGKRYSFLFGQISGGTEGPLPFRNWTVNEEDFSRALDWLEG